jgi:Retinoblastoma-associated protein A domain
MFPWPIEVLDVAPLHFVKVIEPVVLLEQLPKSLIKHLGRIEETIYEQMVWKFDSPIWADIASEDVLSVRDVCWPHHLEDTPSGPGSLGNPTGKYILLSKRNFFFELKLLPDRFLEI